VLFIIFLWLHYHTLRGSVSTVVTMVNKDE